MNPIIGLFYPINFFFVPLIPVNKPLKKTILRNVTNNCREKTIEFSNDIPSLIAIEGFFLNSLDAWVVTHNRAMCQLLQYRISPGQRKPIWSCGRCCHGTMTSVCWVANLASDGIDQHLLPNLTMQTQQGNASATAVAGSHLGNAIPTSDVEMLSWCDDYSELDCSIKPQMA